jgi:hypothetical protein
VPITVTVDVSRRLVLTRGSGVVTTEDVVSARGQALGNPAFDPTYNELFDIRDVTAVQMSGAEMARIAATSVLSRRVRRAFVATTHVQYNMARMFSSLSEPHEQNVHVFRDLAVAEAWLMEAMP